MLAEAGRTIGVDVLTIDETPLESLGVRPDSLVNVAGARIGYAELKARGRKVPTTWVPTAHEQEQWDKLRLLPNVLYTDGEQWAVHFGELSGRVAQLADDVRTAGSRLRLAGGAFERVIREFLLWKPDPPRTIIDPETWPPKFTSELLDLLNVLGLCVDLEPRQAGLLDRICAGPLVTIADLERVHVYPASDFARKPLAPEDPHAPMLL